MIIGLCRKFRCLPSALLAEDVSLLRMLAIVDLGSPEQDDGGAEGGEF